MQTNRRIVPSLMIWGALAAAQLPLAAHAETWHALGGQIESRGVVTHLIFDTQGYGVTVSIPDPPYETAPGAPITGADFTDGQRQQNGTFALITAPADRHYSVLAFTFQYVGEPTRLWQGPDRYNNYSSTSGPTTVAPQVDLVNMRANFSSLYVYQYAVGLPDTAPSGPTLHFSYLANNAGAADWIPIAANADGSYTASWTAPSPYFMAPPSPYPNSYGYDCMVTCQGDRITINFARAAVVPEAQSSVVLAWGLGLVAWRQRQKKRD